MDFINAYGGTILFGLAVFALIAYTLYSKIKSKGGCGCGCGSSESKPSCNSCGTSHRINKKPIVRVE